MLANCGFLGMDGFFILSGFIIHYNYNNRVSSFSVNAIYDFFVHRFSRLYPLYIIQIAAGCLVAGFLVRKGLGFALGTLPFYILMIQSWFYVFYDGVIMPHVLNQPSITWSISTEIFFYACYPPLLWVLLKERMSYRGFLLSLSLLTLAVAVTMRWPYNHPAELNAVGAAFFGGEDAGNLMTDSSFAFWFAYLSPYMRVLEFVVGMGVAELFLKRPEVPPNSLAFTVAQIGSVAFILITFLPTIYSIAIVENSFTIVGFVPALAVLIYASSFGNKTFVGRFFEKKYLVRMGEWSYSIYLFHIFVIVAKPVADATLMETLYRIGWRLSVILFGSMILYNVVERPAQRWLRKVMKR